MKFKKYDPVNEKGACVVRTFSKLFDKEFYKMKEELLKFIEDNNYNSYNDIDAFETYLISNGYTRLDMNEEIIKELNIKYKKCAIFCHKDDFYHMVSFVNGVIYDKDDRCLDLQAITLYYF